MSNAITQTQFKLPEQQSFYKGKVRDVYDLGNVLAMVVTDRISAFDVVLPKGIPFKGQILNQVALHFMQNTKHLVPNWIIASPHPNVTIGKICTPFKVEMVIRGYLVGHAWREYKAGKRVICGNTLPNGMIENQQFNIPIITPTTKAAQGHDEDISKEEIIKQGIVTATDYETLENYTRLLFTKGTEMAAKQGLILADTKYEFGKDADGNICLIDEIHTPDSSRYFYKDSYFELLNSNKRQKQLSKEFVREWLMENGFKGNKQEQIPEMTPHFIANVTERYKELFEQITGTTLQMDEQNQNPEKIEQAILHWINSQKKT